MVHGKILELQVKASQHLMDALSDESHRDEAAELGREAARYQWMLERLNDLTTREEMQSDIQLAPRHPKESETNGHPEE